ncbi:MAG: hypothetical protein EBR01_02650 [Proteobacteria bacterium]|nr:hypothetical protein [Pseudomonadota bacterium]NBY20715.1 hypothetical protein [bacterium]
MFDSFNLIAALTFLFPLVTSGIGLAGLSMNSKKMRELSASSAFLVWVCAVLTGVHVFTKGPVDQVYALVGDPLGFHFSIGLWVDSLSAVLLLLISTIGLIVQRYSIRYLDGDKKQGVFFSWLSFVIGSVILFVTSRNLLVLTLTWFMVSFGVHRLLLHFPEREGAQRAAWRKFVISRMGDVFLGAALVVTYMTLGTFELKDLFHIANNADKIPYLQVFGLTINPFVLMGSLYVLGAMTKSAQFPFHIWLPDTMETPTPVSALMHAGIINAGGFLIVRLSPIVSHAGLALHLLLIIGGLTSLFAGFIYLVQTDVKRSLAYSTIGQMGYMMMQVGVGAYAAAVLHLVMHGFYKSYSFLSAGGSITPHHFSKVKDTKTTLGSYVMSAVVSLMILLAVIVFMQIDVSQKSGGYFLSLFLWASATQGLAAAFRKETTTRTRLFSVLVATVGVVLYWSFLGLFNNILANSIEPIVPHTVSDLLMFVIGAVFVVGFLVGELGRNLRGTPWADRLYVLCLNHFYVEYLWRGMVHKFLGKTQLMPSFENTALGDRKSNKPNVMWN